MDCISHQPLQLKPMVRDTVHCSPVTSAGPDVFHPCPIFSYIKVTIKKIEWAPPPQLILLSFQSFH